MGFRLNLKWSGISVQSPLSTSSSSWPSSYSCRGRDISYLLARSSVASVLYGETETLNDTSKPQPSSSSYYLPSRQIKTEFEEKSNDGLHNLFDDNIFKSKEEDKLAYLTSLQVTHESQYKLLMKNLDLLEGMFVDSDVVRLERDIMNQLERLGALRLFHSCLSSTLSDLSNPQSKFIESLSDSVNNIQVEKVVIQSGKKEVRKLRRKTLLENQKGGSYVTELLPENISTSKRRTSRSRNKRQKIAKNEAEMSSGVKLIADLEKIRIKLEQESGEVANLGSWAEAAGIEKKKLQQQLYYGWRCRDELLKSTRSLVLFIARNYWGFGVAIEDLIQAGYLGVLQGAERFDQSRGYKFSTYVQYWIRKSMSTMISRHARGIRLPTTLSKAINQVQKARKTLSTSNGKYPNDCEIAKFTGLTIAKITSASKCLRIVGSIDQKIGEFTNMSIMEVTADSSIMSTEECVMRQVMKKDIYTLLNGLEPREKRVIILRFGLDNRECKSLEEIGRLLSVSKEWIRKIERSALTKLRNEDSLSILSHYVYMQ